MPDSLAAVEATMRRFLDETETATRDLFGDRDLPLYGVLRYHLGWAEADFRPASFDSGKRTRPLVCLLACRAAGGDARQAIATAAAIELLHNFTLVHDDVQDRSQTRRHRPAVWTLWGEGQAINAGDALFALSQLVLLDSVGAGVPAERVVDLASAFNACVLRIVEGQVLDLGFEQRWDVDVASYLRMIGGKTAALIGFAAWSGATIAGVDAERARCFRDFGESVGLGFQVRDDMLGIWGEPSVTGKPAADDIRRRKKSLPILMLAEQATPAEVAELREIYTTDEVGEPAVARVLDLLHRYGIDAQVQAVVDRYHSQAKTLLHTAAPPGPARAELESLLSRLASRLF